MAQDLISHTLSSHEQPFRFWVSIASATLVLALGYQLFSFFNSPVKSIPGPLLAKLTNLWRLILVWRRSAEITHQELHERYGPAVALGPNMVSINDPQMISVIYSRRTLLRKSEFYAVNDLNIDGRRVQNVFSTRDEHMNTKVMKPALRLFAMSNVLKYENLVDKTIDYFIQRLDERFVEGSNSHTACDMDNWLHYCAWDIIGETTFSERIGFLEQGRDVEDMLQIGHSAMDYFSVVGMMPTLDLFLDKNPICRLGPPFFGPAIAFALQRLERRRKGLDSHDSAASPDFLDGFLEAHKTDPDIVSEDILLAYMMVNVAAGSDTVATELRSCIYHLITNPTALAKLQQELDANDVKAPVSWVQAQSLPYLDACIREGMRLTPGISLPLERVVGPDGLRLPDGKFLAPGVVVGCNPWVMNRHKGVFGEDADKFVPERWLRSANETPTEYTTRLSLMRETDLTFGYGKRMCAGRSLALVEIYKVIGSLCKVYNMEMVDKGRRFKTINSWFMRQTGMDVRLTKRDNSAQSYKALATFPVTKTEKEGNFFKVQTVDESYWDVYLAARPKYERNDFFSLIWDYHLSRPHANKPGFNVAHDIGTGPGNVASHLTNRFRTVIASDSNATHLQVARDRIIGAKNVSFEHLGAEEVGNHHALGSADFISAAECLPLIDADRAVNSFSNLLRPGGTLAIWFYGRPYFVSAKNPSAISKPQPVVQEIFGNIVDLAFRRVIEPAPVSMKAGFERSADRMASWLDDVAFPETEWVNVQRRKWNTNADLSFVGQKAIDRPVRVSSRVGEREQVQESSDTTFWAEEWSIDNVKQFVRVLLPDFATNNPAHDLNIQRNWTELEAAMGGRTVVWHITWPVVLIMATRK